MRQLNLDRFLVGRLRSSFLPALLVIALAVTGIVTFYAYQASKEHRAVVERVLGAYVWYVAEEVEQATQLAINSCLELWLAPVHAKRNGDSRDLDVGGYCGEQDGGRFDLNLVTGNTIGSSALPAELLAWLADTIPENAGPYLRRNWRIGALTTTVAGRPELIAYGWELDGERPVRAVGFVAKGALPYVLTAARANVPVPEAIADVGKLGDYFVISDNANHDAANAGEPVFFTIEGKTAPEFGGITLATGLRQAGLLRLAPAGLPRNRGWEFLGLFALAAGLVASSLLLLRREAQLARTRANFVSGVSHELRTPLAQIRMFAEMLLLGRVRSEADRRRSLEIIDTEARRLSQLVENVLQVARAENGHIRVNPTTMSVAPIVRECVETFSVLAQARGIDFRMEMEEELVAPVDSAALRQIVLNLLDNAAKYGPDGQRVVVGVALYDDTARIWVDDEGNGIPVRDRERVFDAFFRSRDAQHTTGSGIGLSVVRELVVLHGGHAWIEDAPDAGTRVVVQFPGAYLAAQSQPAGDFAVA